MDENKIEPSVFRYILKHTKKDQVILLLFTLISMPFIYASLEIPKIIINSALGGVDIPDQILGFPIDQIQYLLILCFTFLILVLVNGVLKYVNNIYRGVLGERMLRRFRYDMYIRLLRFPIPRFKQISQGEVIPMVTAESEPLGGFIGDAFALPAFQGGLLLTYLFFIFNQDVWLGLAAIALYPPQLYIIPKLQRRVNELAKERVKAVRRFADKVGESVSGISDIHVNDTSHYEKAYVSERLGTIYRIRFDIYRKKFFIKFLNNFLGQLTPFFFYAIGGYFVIMGDLSLGALVAVLAAYKDLESPWKELLKFYQITEDVRVKYTQIINQFQPEHMLKRNLQEDQDTQVDFSKGSLKVTSVSYSEDEFVKSLDSVSFTMDKTQHIGLLGQGGSGQSVLTQLVARLLHPGVGNLKIAEQDIAGLSEAILGRNIAYVDQQSYVFTGTLRENLLYGLKNRPRVDDQIKETPSATREQYIKDAELAANSTDDIDSDWINIESTGFADYSAFNQHVSEVLKISGLDNDVYQLGLYSSISTSQYPELAEGILDARKRLRTELQKDEYNKLVEILDEKQYNTNLSVAENLFLGVPVKSGIELESLVSNPVVAEAIEEAQLKEPLFRIGLQTAKIMVDIFADVPEGSPMFERFNFIQADELPVLARLAKIPEDSAMESMSDEDTELITNMSFKLTVARHRLGLLTPDIRKKIVNAQALLKEKLGETNDLIDFYSDQKIATQLTIQDNILFGRVAYGQANAQQKVGKLINDVIMELGLKDQITEVGLDYSVGVGGARLTSTQRQKLTIARALVKNPSILIVNEATSIFDKKTEDGIIQRVLDKMKSKTVLWVLGTIDHMDAFDHLLVLDKGRLVAEGVPGEIKTREDIIKQLS